VDVVSADYVLLFGGLSECWRAYCGGKHQHKKHPAPKNASIFHNNRSFHAFNEYWKNSLIERCDFKSSFSIGGQKLQMPLTPDEGGIVDFISFEGEKNGTEEHCYCWRIGA
jgi:hypothetical protein